MKVFLVSSGDYSDWTVRGIFSTREKAEEFMRMYPPRECGDYGDYNEIDEHVMDFGLKVPKGLQQFKVAIGWETGKTQVWLEKRFPQLNSLKDQEQRFRRGNDVKGVHYEDHLCLTVWAKNENHAAKIASERRRIALALKAE